MHDGSWRVTKIIGENNHALDAALSHFMPSHREVSKSLKRHLVAHDIAGLRPSKSIRLLKVQTHREVYNEKVEKSYHSSPLEEIPGGYPTMTEEFKRYNMLKKWFDMVYDVKIRDFKNVMKVILDAYLNLKDDMVVPDVGGGDDSDDDNLTYIRNSIDVRPCGRPQTNRHRR
ncbi:hypothetical protein RND71_018377 [Anisodus tanguticus]|uniref:Uncharacterized protein n=1 Tax=Anisodus tanguticus TaxID=243964 RepID=A0AAE1S455_9SOLA|nr:hypothetical protein RND71_018377 [Anisodus tanguticus]